MRRSYFDLALQLAFLVLCVGIWQAATNLWAIPEWLLPSPINVALAGVKFHSLLFDHFVITLTETIVGFTLGLLVSVPLASLVASSPFAYRTVYPLIAALQSIPRAAIAPLLLVWFGAGIWSKITIVFLMSFFPILVNTVTGMQNVRPELILVVNSMSANRAQIMWWIRLPNALPYIFSGCKVAITLAVVGAVIGEFIGGDGGLGYLILVSSSQLRSDLAFVAIFALAILGSALFSLISILERFAAPWYMDADEITTTAKA